MPSTFLALLCRLVLPVINIAGWTLSTRCMPQGAERQIWCNVEPVRPSNPDVGMRPAARVEGGALMIERLDFTLRIPDWQVLLQTGATGRLPVGIWAEPDGQRHAMRTLLSLIFPFHQRLLLHAASFGGAPPLGHADSNVARVDQNPASGSVLCVGPSGRGKSTLSRAALARGHTLLSDEISCVEVTDDATYAHATPFWGEPDLGDTRREEDPKVLRLARMFWLEQSTVCAIQPCDRAQSTLRLLTQTLFPFAAVPRGELRVLADELQGRVLDLLGRLLLQYRLLELRSTKATSLDMVSAEVGNCA